MSLEINVNTPIIQYELNGREVNVKRDDLMGDGVTLPPWGKLKAIKMLFEHTTTLGFPFIDPAFPVSYLCLRSSWSGWALGKIGTELGFDVRIAYPNSKDFPKEMLEKIEDTGAKLIPLKPNMLSVCLGMLKKKAKAEGFQMFPYAFEHPVFLKHFSDRIGMIEENYDNLVLVGGTPCTGIGLIKGFKGKKIHMVLTCTEATAMKQLKKYGLDNDTRIELHTTPYDFYDEMLWLESPWPTNNFWEKKAVWWLSQKENIDKIEGNILFWNLGQ